MKRFALISALVIFPAILVQAQEYRPLQGQFSVYSLDLGDRGPPTAKTRRSTFPSPEMRLAKYGNEWAEIPSLIFVVGRPAGESAIWSASRTSLARTDVELAST